MWIMSKGKDLNINNIQKRKVRVIQLVIRKNNQIVNHISRRNLFQQLIVRFSSPISKNLLKNLITIQS